MGCHCLWTFPGSTQSAVEQAASDNATRGPIEGPEVTSAEQGHSSTDPLTTEPEAQASPQLVETSKVQTPAHTHPPARTKTYPHRDIHPCVRFGFEQTKT